MERCELFEDHVFVKGPPKQYEIWKTKANQTKTKQKPNKNNKPDIKNMFSSHQAWYSLLITVLFSSSAGDITYSLGYDSYEQITLQ